MRYETIPHEVDAMQLSFMTLGEISSFTGCSNYTMSVRNGVINVIITVNNVKMLVVQDDYIVKDAGEILIVKKKDFEQNYRKIEED